MKVLITGVAGNLGKVISQHLTSDNIRVVGIDTIERLDHLCGSGFRFYNCSITNKARLKRIFRKEKPTNVIHLACTFNRVRNHETEMKIDIGGSKNVLDISNSTPSVRQIIYSSSAAAYGGHEDNELWLDETQPLRPGDYRYGIIKKKVEELYFNSDTRDDLNLVSLRICTVVGPSFNKKGSAVSILINSKYILNHWKENKVQFLHEDDLNRVITKIITDNKIQGKYNLAPDSYSQINQLLPDKKYVNLPVSFIRVLLWLFYNSRILNLRPSSFKQSMYPIVLSPKKLIRRYDFKFRYDSRQAFLDTLNHYKYHKPEMALM